MLLRFYFEQLRAQFQLKEQADTIDFLLNHPYRVLILPVLRIFRKIKNRVSYQLVNDLTSSNKPNGKFIDNSFYSVHEIDNLPSTKSVSFNAGSNNGNLIAPDIITSKFTKVVFIHAYYADEFNYILERLSDFSDYDIIITSPHKELLEKASSFFGYERFRGVLFPNSGRDVLPFLFSLAIFDMSKYQNFVKVHTKRSKHLRDKGKWFKINIDFLLGAKSVTDSLFKLMGSDKPEIYGESLLPIQDHFSNNKYWLSHFINGDLSQSKANFIPGTMFIGNGVFLRKIKSMELHQYKIESEKGQLDGCCVHALERYFGFLAVSANGKCETVEYLARKEGVI